MFTTLSVLLANNVDTGSASVTTSTFTTTRWISYSKSSEEQNLMGTLAGAVWTRLRGEDGLCLPLLPPKPTCSTQTRVWRWWSAAAPAPLQPPEPERPLPPPARLLPYVLPSAATHPLATHIISAVLPAANLAMIESK